MKSILLIRRLQSDKEWESDCYNIASKTVAELNYKFPYSEYTELLKESLGRFIAEKEIYISQPLDIQELFDEVFRQGFNYALKHEDSPEYFEFNLTDKDIKNINELIEEYIKLFYNKDNALVKKLMELSPDTVIIYPVKFYGSILEVFYENSNPYFKASYNNDDECIKEYCEVNNIDKYNLINL